MSLSWNELGADHKIVFLFESLANEQHQQSPVACRVCEKVFFDNTSLLEHFLSHYNHDGTLKGSQRNSVAQVNPEPSARGSVSPAMSDLSLGNYLIPLASSSPSYIYCHYLNFFMCRPLDICCTAASPVLKLTCNLLKPFWTTALPCFDKAHRTRFLYFRDIPAVELYFSFRSW